MKKFGPYFLLVIFFMAGLVFLPPTSFAQSCKIDKVEEGNFKINDAKKANEIIELITSKGNFNHSGATEVLESDINNDAKKEYIVKSWEGTGHYLSWGVYSLDGNAVPENFWGTHATELDSFFDAGGPSRDIWITTICAKNYFGFTNQDNSKQLYLIESHVRKACSPEWIDYYKTRDITEQWSSFCETSFAKFDATKSREKLIGYYSLNDACLSDDGYDNDDRPLLKPGRSEIILRPHSDKDLSVTIITGGFWADTKGPEQVIYTGIATYDPQHGYVIDQPLTNVSFPALTEKPQKIYLVPEKNRLVLESITYGPISNSSWSYSQRKNAPDKCNYVPDPDR